jgi:hypothetical protein
MGTFHIWYCRSTKPASLWVFIPFHWVFEAEEERKERKEREKGEIVGNQAHLLCFVKSTVY